MIKTILITIILALSPTAPRTSVIKDAFRYTNKEVAQAHINLKISKIQKVREVRRQRLESSGARWLSWSLWKIRRGIDGRMLVILPEAVALQPIGLAPVCNPQGVAIVNYMQSDPVGRFLSEIVIAHELGHLLGAEHLEGQNIMSPFMYKNWYPDLPHYSKESIMQIQSCGQ